MKKTTQQVHEQITRAHSLVESRLEKKLPYDELSERFVLGCILLEEFGGSIAFDILGNSEGSASPFYVEKNRLMFDVLRTLYFAGTYPNAANVLGYVTRNGMAQMWPAVEIVGLTSLEMASTFCARECRKILELHNKRKFILENYRLALDGTVNEQTLSELLDEADKVILDLRNERKQGDPVALESVNLFSPKRFEQGWKTGIDGIDKLLHDGVGAQGGDYVIIAARPSVGKTTFAMNVAGFGVENTQPCLIISLEMTTEQIGLKFFEYVTGVATWKFNPKYADRPMITTEEAEAVNRFHQYKTAYKIFISDSSYVNCLSIRSHVANLKRKNGIKAVFVDYLQLVRPVTSYPNSKEREVSETSAYLKAIAKEFDIPIFVLSQLNRQSLSRADKKPSLGDLRDSGSLEQDADTVIFLHDAAMATLGNSEQIRSVECIVAKNRLGPVGTVGLQFDTQRSRFREDFNFKPFENNATENSGIW